MKERDKRVLVGMSGGIDSTATCLMLQEQGYEIVGVTMRVWGDEPQDARELAPFFKRHPMRLFFHSRVLPA